LGNLAPAQDTPPPADPPAPANRVLALDGNESYVELPANIFNKLTAATVEGWVKWDTQRRYSRFFDFGTTWRAMLLGNRADTKDLYFALGRPPFTQDSELSLSVPGMIQTGRWCHLAVVTGPGGVRLFVNGVQVAEDAERGSFALLGNGDHNYLGRSNWLGVSGAGDDQDFHGRMDEVRVWRAERSEEEIRAGMTAKLTGKEPTLMGYWNFDDEANPGRDLSPHGHHGTLHGQARSEAEALPDRPRRMKTESVLNLDGTKSYLELPPGIHAGLKEATIEAWVLWRLIGAPQVQRIFNYGAAWDDLSLYAGSDGSLRFAKGAEGERVTGIQTTRVLDENQWHHVAVVTGPGGMRLYLDGLELGTDPQTDSFGSIVNPARYYFGQKPLCYGQEMPGTAGKWIITASGDFGIVPVMIGLFRCCKTF
jgi:hypothetical protein